MMTIRREQIAAFRAPSFKAFEDRMMVHLHKLFPKQCKAASEMELRKTIQSGIEVAAKYGIMSERDVCKYIDFMMVLGQDFDKDPKLPWAESVLNNRGLRDSAAKMERLRRAHRQHLNGGGFERAGR
jgi:hypothetical protein